MVCLGKGSHRALAVLYIVVVWLGGVGRLIGMHQILEHEKTVFVEADGVVERQRVVIYGLP